ncbi:hypothetical protein ACFV3E_24825 [Streptomyces sp. NPDC059718]
MNYDLIDGDLLRRLMRCPDKGGTRHTARSLAAAAGLSKSKVNRMTNGHSKRVTEPQATATAEAVGVRRKAIFTPSMSTSTDIDTKGDPPT